MNELAKTLQEINPFEAHIVASRGGIEIKDTCIPEKEKTITQQVEEIKTLEGSHGTIKIFKQSREVKETDQDIHSLIAKVLLMKQKRLASGEQNSSVQ
ncbi:hypothetical protein [Cytobacillus gottheilii]|uniref:hypothetical protein n=1 Tax=Cytobacillus gottheilii TaxID=859144 RepID=UPI000829C90C|nr:hypothetical protein [Cytobacillus gottheilii]